MEEESAESTFSIALPNLLTILILCFYYSLAKFENRKKPNVFFMGLKSAQTRQTKFPP